MRSLAHSAFVCLAVAACLQSTLALAQGTEREKSSTMFTPQQLVEDFRIARKALEEGHPGVYRYVTKAKLDRQFDAAEKKLDHPMDAYGFFRVLAPTVAAIECGHTGVNLPVTEQDLFHKSVLALPLQITFIGKKVFIFRDYAHEDGALAGSELLAINGTRIDKIVASLLAVVPADGEIPTSRRRHVSRLFSHGLSLLLGLNAPYAVTYRQAGKERTVTLAGMKLSAIEEVTKAKYPQDDRNLDHSADLTYFDENKIAVMTIYGFGGFADKEQKKPLNVFLDEAFAQFQQQRTQALILDLRNNGGGEDALGKQLFSYLTDQPFTYYNDLVLNAREFDFMRYARSPLAVPEGMVQKRQDGRFRVTDHPNWGLQQPGKPMFTGKVFVVMNGDSFSTTCEFLSMAHFHHRAVFVGEEAGGGYYGNTSGITRMLTLPNTNVSIRVPFIKYVMAVSGYRYPKRGVMPDYPVQPTITDKLTGRDPEMVVALALARKANTSKQIVAVGVRRVRLVVSP
jgi:C-terminal processing protease CtpA/Prc